MLSKLVIVPKFETFLKTSENKNQYFRRSFTNNTSNDSLSKDKVISEEKQTWKLFRMDDHGRTNLIRSFPSRDEAQEFLADMEKRGKSPWGEGHKQTYWITND